MRTLRIAIGNYGVTKPILDGRVPLGRLKLEFVHVEPITAAMRRMVRGLEFDVCEMAWTTYLCAKSVGKPITAVPVFVTRNFHHWAAFVNAKSGIRTPKDLEGRPVAVNRGYTVTTGIWIRGILQHEYGVDLGKVTWWPTDDEHVAEFKAPANVDYGKQGKAIGDLLTSGATGAAVGDVRVDSPDVKSLISEAREAGYAYFRKTGVYPINHGLTVKDSVLAEEPWVAEELFRVFKAAKEVYLGELKSAANPSPADQTALALGRVVGGDPFPFGVEPNRKALETISRYAVDQHVTSKNYAPEELFAPSTLRLA